MATPTTTIDALPAADALSLADLIIVQQSGVTKKATVEAVGLGTVTDVVWVGPDAPSDPDIELWYDTDEVALTGLVGETVDTGEAYRIILFSDGTVRAIPVDVVAPATPTDFAYVARVNSVRLTWDAALGAYTYIVYRDGVQIGTASSTSYRDRSVVVGATYEYTVQSVHFYGLRSAQSDPLEVFIDPALNVAPTVELRSWPASIALGNRAMIRINATDVDGQTLANVLGTDVGSLTATADPTVWILEPV